jgi:predicted HicB family RNase H-like nuclease
MAHRRAHADTYAERVNRAVALLGEHRSTADARRALQAEHRLSERQARRYVRAAQAEPEGVEVPERTAVFTVRLPPSLIGRIRAGARARGESLSATVAEALRAGLEQRGDGGAAG